MRMVLPAQQVVHLIVVVEEMVELNNLSMKVVLSSRDPLLLAVSFEKYMNLQLT